jgi:hypothetical protein
MAIDTLELVLMTQHQNARKKGQDNCTLWYDCVNGEIYGIGPSNPKSEYESCVPLMIKYDAKGAVPEPVNGDRRFSGALRKAFQTLTEFRASFDCSYGRFRTQWDQS